MSASSRTTAWPRGIITLGLFVYCGMLLVKLPAWAPDFLKNGSETAKRALLRACRSVLSVFTGGSHPGDFDGALYLLLIAGAVPVLFAFACGRKPRDLGFRKPNRLAFRYFVVAVLVALPFLIWMVQSPTISRGYVRQLERLGMVAFGAYYLVNMFTEHLFLHGAVLGLVRRDGRWPEPVPLSSGGRGFTRLLRWLGMAQQPLRDSGLAGWLGLAPGGFGPMMFSALLFGMVHMGKDVRELILSFPGGLAQGYLAYRSNSWWTPFLVHLATALIAMAMMTR